MLVTTGFCLLIIFWTSLFLLDYMFRNHEVQWYINFADHYGFQVSPLQLRFYVSRYDGSQFFSTYSSRIRSFKNSRLWLRIIDIWFSFGAFIGLFCFISTTIYLSYLLLCELFNFFALFSVKSLYDVRISPDGNYKTVDDTKDIEEALSYVPYQGHVQSGITPIIPGINIPMSHLPLFMTVLIIAGIVHELGHAFASVNANTRVTGFGIFLYVIYPGAFTEIDTDELERLTTAQKLRIYCAGIWHNLVLAGVAYLVYLSISLICFPFFETNVGLLVTDVSQQSGLIGPNGLRLGHVITGLNGCEVKNKNDYLNCLSKFDGPIPQYGYYVPATDIYPLTANPEKVVVIRGEVACCQEFENITSASHICFQYHNFKRSSTVYSSQNIPVKERGDTPGFHRANRANFGAVFNIPTSAQKYAGELNRDDYSYACLPGREVSNHSPCDEYSNQYKNGLLCVYPAMYNGTALLKFEIANETNPVIYIGQLSEARYLLNLQELVPRYSWISYLIPNYIELTCKYFITFSLALGLLNAVPCYGLDGQFIGRTLVDYFLNFYQSKLKDNLSSIILLYGTTIFILNVIIGFIKFLIAYSF